MMVNDNVFDLVCCIGLDESVTVNVWLVVPAVPAKGVPLIVPGDNTFSANPFGNAAFTDQTYGRTPPVAPNVVGGYF